MRARHVYAPTWFVAFERWPAVRQRAVIDALYARTVGFVPDPSPDEAQLLLNVLELLRKADADDDIRDQVISVFEERRTFARAVAGLTEAWKRQDQELAELKAAARLVEHGGQPLYAMVPATYKPMRGTLYGTGAVRAVSGER